jgi:hypothetical protein
MEICQFIMKLDPTLARELYVDLERDVHEIYLNPKDMYKRELLGLLREEMREDQTHPLGIGMGKQSAHEPRTIWSISEKGPSKAISIEATYPLIFRDPVSTILYPSTATVGHRKDDRFKDIAYFNLMDLMSSRETQGLSPTQQKELEDLSYAFAELNEKMSVVAMNSGNDAAYRNFNQLKINFIKSYRKLH